MEKDGRSTGFYAPELDGLRWFAVAGVMITHFSWTWKNLANWGTPGVRLFFVLSGFLITLLLLRARAKIEAGCDTAKAALLRFWIRRVFRLWPLYFASLGISYALHVDGTESSFAWHATFATNIYVFAHQRWPGLLSHYWTLAVEQQFYFLWPVVVLGCSHGALRIVLVLMAIAGPFSRWLPLFLGTVRPEYDVLLFGCLDFFACGAAVALLVDSGLIQSLVSKTVLIAGMIFTAFWLAFGSWLWRHGHGIYPTYYIVYDGSIQAMGFALLVVYVIRHPTELLPTCLRWRPFVFLGKISYGIYILHNLSHRIGPSLTRQVTGKNYLDHEFANVLGYVTLSIGAATITYFCFEEPLRRLGQRLTRPTTNPRPLVQP